jgi:hypothetical protein
MDKKTFILAPTLQPLGNICQMATMRSSSKNTRKLTLQSILNNNLPHAHMESEFDVLGVAR